MTEITSPVQPKTLRPNEFAHCEYMRPFPETRLAMRNTLRNTAVAAIAIVGDAILDMEDKTVAAEEHIKAGLRRRRHNFVSLGRLTASTVISSALLGLCSATAAHAGEITNSLEQVVGYHPRQLASSDRTGTTAVTEVEAINNQLNRAYGANILNTDGFHNGKVVEFVDKCPDVRNLQTVPDTDIDQAVRFVKTNFGTKQITLTYGCKGPSPYGPIKLSNPQSHPVSF
jgi:hypothetical protein